MRKAQVPSPGLAINYKIGEDLMSTNSVSTTDALLNQAPSRLTLEPISAIDAEPVWWLWDDRFPLSHLSLAVGKPDIGKSQFAVWLSARVTRGTLPGCFSGQPKGVLYVATEDSFKLTIRPRLEAAGADLERVFRVTSNEHPGKGYTLNIFDDLGELARMIAEGDLGLIIFDPIVSVVSGAAWNKSEDIRDALTPLAEMLEATGCSAVGLMHFRKAFSDDVLTQIAGSGAWAQVVRAAVAFARDPDADEKRVIMSQVKSNLGRGDLPSLTYTFQPCEVATKKGPARVSKIVWGDESAWSVEDILTGKNTDKAKGLLDTAKEWLENYLGDGKPVLKTDVVRAGLELGHKERTIERAKSDLRIVKGHEDGNSRGPMTWRLVTDDAGEVAKLAKLAKWAYPGWPTSPTSPESPKTLSSTSGETTVSSSVTQLDKKRRTCATRGQA